MNLNRVIYLGYYIKQLDRPKLKQFLDYTSEETEQSRASLLADMLKSVFRYNISLLEYFQFRFFELSESERRTWAGTGYMYEFQKSMNPPSARQVLEEKPIFMKEYAEFIRHDSATVEDLKSDQELLNKILNAPSGKLVLKRSDGGSGKGIEVISTDGLTPDKLFKELNRSGNDMVEEFVVQHKELMRLAPAGLNTLRVITQVDQNDEVTVIGCRLRMTVHSHVDNMAAGNIAASVDTETGLVNSDAVYSDMTKTAVKKHPVTGVEIKGFQIPFWPETMDMVQKAAIKNPSNRSIGWDVAITDKGPELIEGNHDWCKLLWQLPERKGLKHLLEPYNDTIYR
jgi:hypothetical protein